MITGTADLTVPSKPSISLDDSGWAFAHTAAAAFASSSDSGWAFAEMPAILPADACGWAFAEPSAVVAANPANFPASAQVAAQESSFIPANGIQPTVAEMATADCTGPSSTANVDHEAARLYPPLMVHGPDQIYDLEGVGNNGQWASMIVQ